MGRFAPSPSGDLHLGSLYAAAASYLDARANHGRWLLRMEDLDTPRVVRGSAAGILHTLSAFGFEWDDAVTHQSARVQRYAEALDLLHDRDLTFDCSCSRTALADEERYPGYCRNGIRTAGAASAIRLRVDPGFTYVEDRIQGPFRQDVAAAVGDFVVRRRDHVFAYVLAVVVDDAAQGVTHVVRGADLLDNTPRQMYLQRCLGLAHPAYAHVPVLMEPDGAKLAKSARSVPLDERNATTQLLEVFRLLGLAPSAALADSDIASAWAWAIAAWNINTVPKRLAHYLHAQ